MNYHFQPEPAPQAIEPASKPILDISADFSEADLEFLQTNNLPRTKFIS